MPPIQNPNFTSSAFAVFAAAEAVARRRGHTEWLPEHVLETLLVVPPIVAVLTEAGLDVPRIARSVGDWLSARGPQPMAIDRVPFRAADARFPAAVHTGTPIVMRTAAETRSLVELAFTHMVRPPVDLFALLLALLDSERTSYDWFMALFRRHAVKERAWLSSNGASWRPIAGLVARHRDAIAHWTGDAYLDGTGDGVGVRFHDDDSTSAEFVCDVLIREAGLTATRALWLTSLITFRGQAIVTRLPRDEARRLIERVDVASRAAGFELRVSREDRSE